MIQKSNRPKRQSEPDPPKSRDKKNLTQKSAARNPLQNGLQINEGIFKQFLEAVPDGLVIVNAQGKIQFVNNQVEGMFGYQPEEMLGKPVELLIPDHFSRHKEYREAYLRNLHTRPMESGLALFASRKDGTEFQADISLSPIKIEEETYIIAAIRDITLQRLSEKQLKQSLQRYQQTLDNMLEGCQIIDFDWRYIYVNDVAASQGHRKPEELLMRTMMEVYPGIENTEMFTALRHCMEERVPRHMENRFDLPDGATSWFKLSIQPVPEGIFILSIDITERRQTEEALLESNAQFRTLFEASPDAIVLIDPQDNWTILDCNAAACHMNGYTRDELIGQSIDILNLEPSRVTERAKYLEQLHQAGVLHMETFHRRKDGTVFPVEVSTSLITLGGRDMVLGIDRDITERKQAEALLVKSEKRFRVLVEKSMEEVSLIDADGALLFESPTMRRPLGYPPGSFLGRNLFELFHPDDLAHAIKLLEQIVGQPGSHCEELFRLRHQDGSWRWMEGTMTNMLDEPAVQAVVINYRDVTERKWAEEELFQSEGRYRTLFEDSPISLWEEDFSAAKQRIEGLRQQGITDFRVYFSSHPQVVAECAALVRVIDVNKAALKLYQTQNKEDLLSNLAEVLEPEMLKPFEEELICMAEGRTQYTWEGAERTMTDERIDVRVNWIVVPGHEENFSKVIVSIVDLTERKQAEEALRVSEERFRSLYENSTIGMYRTTSDGKILLANPALVSMLGYSSFAELSQRDLEKEGYESGYKRSLFRQKIENDGVLIGLESVWTKKDGTVIFIRESAKATRDAEGKVIYYEGTVEDITGRKQAEEEVRTRTDELRTLYELSRALADADDLDEILNQVNRHAVESVHTTFARVALLESNTFVMRAAYPIRVLDHDLLVGKRVSSAMLPYCQRVLEQNKSVILRNSSQEVSGYERAALLLDFAQTLCLIPLRVGKPGFGSKQTLGLLMLGETRSEGREPFTPAKILLSESIGDQAASAIRRMLLHEQTERRLQHLTALREIDQIIASSSGLDLSLRTVLTQVTEQLSVDAATVWLFNPASNMLEFSAGRGFQSKVFEQAKPLRLGEGYAGRAALEHCTIHISDLTAQEDNPRLIRALANETFASYYGVPLIAKGSIKGVLEVFQRIPLEPDEEWLDFLDILAGQAAIAIDNATLFENLQNSNTDLILAYDTTLEGWSAALDLRDKETEGHTQRVTEITVRLAESMGFNQHELVQVRRGALLHDIGKMGVPDRILLKPDKLTDEEWETMRKHPVYAYQLLKGIAYLRQALDIPYCHHEKWDGTGYPRGLKGEEIPLAARIFAVVDIYDALTSDRPYRKGWTREKTLNHIRELSDTHLDPQIVEAFLKMVSKGE